MGATVSSGPYIITGTLMGSSGLPEYNIDAGPSITYQGDALPDVRMAPINKDNLLPGTVKCHQNFPYIMTCDVVPSTLQNNNIVAAAHPTSGTAMTLASASAGISTGVPFQQFNTSTIVTAGIALDYGFDLAVVTSGSATITPTDWTKYTVGMPIVIPNVGNSGGTTALLTYVVSVNPATPAVVLADKALANGPLGSNYAPVGAGDSWGVLYNGTKIRPTWAQPYIAAGDALILNPYEGIARGVRIVGSSLTAGGNVTISGYDFYGQPQTEVLAIASGSTTTWSNKTYRFIQSVVPAFTDGAHNISVGTSDVFGFAVRSDKWEYMNIFWAGAFLTASTGWIAADTTSPATTSTKDVRGIIEIGANGPVGSGASGGASNGTLRLAIFATVPTYNLTQANPTNATPFYGITPV